MREGFSLSSARRKTRHFFRKQKPDTKARKRAPALAPGQTRLIPKVPE
jgi:hypothetical protein